MWIIDSCSRQGVDLWMRDGGVQCQHIDSPQQFLLHLPDPSPHEEMLDALAGQYPFEQCTFSTISGSLAGYRITAGREVAEAIEQQSGYTAQLYNVDIRPDQKYLAEHDLVPCGNGQESRFDPDIPCDLRQMEIAIGSNPHRNPALESVEVTCDRTEHLAGPEQQVLSDLLDVVNSADPDIILFQDADAWMAKLVRAAKKHGLDLPFSRTGKFRRLDSRSYWSYGRVEHREGALLPDGRILIDTSQSFVYREGGINGVLLASRLTGLSPNLASRLTPGTLVSGYEIYEAFRQGIAVPFRKSDAECVRKLTALKAADRGGMMFQPDAGIYADVSQIDFTSLYPSIIVQENLSPETIGHMERSGFLAGALKPLLGLRIRTKRAKKTRPGYEGIDSILKWMLVTCFGYTGYKNAKFGRIEVHEAITARSREILMQTKDIAESEGLTVLHGIVDCVWVTGKNRMPFRDRVERETDLPCEQEDYDWIAFLPLENGLGAYNRYFGRLSDGSIRVRGIAARRHDTPEFIRQMQKAMLSRMADEKTLDGLHDARDDVAAIRREYRDRLPASPVQDLLISRRISRLTFDHRCLEGAAVQAYQQAGLTIAPGMKIRYVVRDARHYCVDTEWDAGAIDRSYYRNLLDKAADEIAFVFRKIPSRPG